MISLLFWANFPSINFFQAWAKTRKSDHRTYPIKKTLHKPLKSVETRMTSFVFLMKKETIWRWGTVHIYTEVAVTKHTPNLNYQLTKFLKSLDSNFFKILSWCSWNRSSFGKPGTKKPGKEMYKQDYPRQNCWRLFLKHYNVIFISYNCV